MGYKDGVRMRRKEISILKEEKLSHEIYANKEEDLIN